MPRKRRSALQIEAARRNGARSKGPLTLESRARSAANAIKHGLTAATVLLPGESRERFQQLLEDLLTDLAPQTTLEYTAVEDLAAALWKQRRSWSFEAGYFDDDPGDGPLHRHIATWKKLHKPGQDFQNLLLQQARLNRQIDRAYQRFRDLETLRLAEAEVPGNQSLENQVQN